PAGHVRLERRRQVEAGDDPVALLSAGRRRAARCVRRAEARRRAGWVGRRLDEPGVWGLAQGPPGIRGRGVTISRAEQDSRIVFYGKGHVHRPALAAIIAMVAALLAVTLGAGSAEAAAPPSVANPSVSGPIKGGVRGYPWNK